MNTDVCFRGCVAHAHVSLLPYAHVACIRNAIGHADASNATLETCSMHRSRSKSQNDNELKALCGRQAEHGTEWHTSAEGFLQDRP
jgi:hypothetical protein